jgi:hypothetical protein
VTISTNFKTPDSSSVQLSVPHKEEASFLSKVFGRVEFNGINLNPLARLAPSQGRRIEDTALSAKLLSIQSKLEKCLEKFEDPLSPLALSQQEETVANTQNTEEVQKLKSVEKGEKIKFLGHIIDFTIITWFDSKILGFDQRDSFEFYKQQLKSGNAINAYLQHLNMKNKFHYILASLIIPILKRVSNFFINTQDFSTSGFDSVKESLINYFKDSCRTKRDIALFLTQARVEFANHQQSKNHSFERIRKKFNAISCDLLNPHSKLPIIGKLVNFVGKKIFSKLINDVDPFSKLMNVTSSSSYVNSALNYKLCQIMSYCLRDLQKSRDENNPATQAVLQALSYSEKRAASGLSDETQITNEVDNLVELLDLNLDFEDQSQTQDFIQSTVSSFLNQQLQTLLKSIAAASSNNESHLTKSIDFLKMGNSFFEDEPLKDDQAKSELIKQTKDMLASELKFQFTEKAKTHDFKHKKDLVVHILNDIKEQSLKFISNVTKLKADLLTNYSSKNNIRIIIATLDYFHLLKERFDLLLETTGTDDMGGDKQQVEKIINSMAEVIEELLKEYEKTEEELKEIKCLQDQQEKIQSLETFSKTFKLKYDEYVKELAAAKQSFLGVINEPRTIDGYFDTQHPKNMENEIKQKKNAAVSCVKKFKSVENLDEFKRTFDEFVVLEESLKQTSRLDTDFLNSLKSFSEAICKINHLKEAILNEEDSGFKNTMGKLADIIKIKKDIANLDCEIEKIKPLKTISKRQEECLSKLISALQLLPAETNPDVFLNALGLETTYGFCLFELKDLSRQFFWMYREAVMGACSNKTLMLQKFNEHISSIIDYTRSFSSETSDPKKIQEILDKKIAQQEKFRKSLSQLIIEFDVIQKKYAVDFEINCNLAADELETKAADFYLKYSNRFPEKIKEFVRALNILGENFHIYLSHSNYNPFSMKRTTTTVKDFKTLSIQKAKAKLAMSVQFDEIPSKVKSICEEIKPTFVTKAVFVGRNEDDFTQTSVKCSDKLMNALQNTTGLSNILFHSLA